MDTQVAPIRRRVEVEHGLELSVQEWPGAGRPFLLVHGLASNCHTWDLVAQELNHHGHYVISVDQRGHGHSDKPDQGYGFDEVTSDLRHLIERLGLKAPIIAGQSWGGNVVLDFAARYPRLPGGLVLVDGGFIDLSRDGESWEAVSERLRPPNLIGTPRSQMLERMRSFHPDWSETQLEMQMANFETLPDETIRPWLTLGRHMEIVRALYFQKPGELYSRVHTPTLIAVVPGPSAGRQAAKLHEVEAAESALARVKVRWFNDSVHDIHVDKPRDLAGWLLNALKEGFFGEPAMERTSAK
jgi:pimeloyl-ACP methyl ester carboxylesterase